MIDRRLTNRPRMKGKSPKDDTQRHRVYSMERTLVGEIIGSKTDMEVLENVVRHACREWRCDLPCWGKEPRARVYGSTTDTEIRLNPDFDGQTMGVMLHELAHWITDRVFPEATDHGPDFCGVYRYLLDRYNVLPVYCFDVLAAHWDVEHNVVDPHSV